MESGRVNGFKIEKSLVSLYRFQKVAKLGKETSSIFLFIFICLLGM